jgi:hypothetical protein
MPGDAKMLELAPKAPFAPSIELGEFLKAFDEADEAVLGACVLACAWLTPGGGQARSTWR